MILIIEIIIEIIEEKIEILKIFIEIRSFLILLILS